MLQLAGIGFSHTQWATITQRLQKPISLQMSSPLFGESLEHHVPRIWPTHSAQATEKLLKSKPDWLIFLPSAFESPNTYVDYLRDIQLKSEQNVHLVMGVDQIENDLIPLVELQPVLELANGMQFNLTDADFLLMHHIQSFPRMRMGKNVQTIEYIDHTGNLIRQAQQDIKLNTLISLKNIKRIATSESADTAKGWLLDFLKQQPKSIEPEQVVGILREEKGCYLFPGIPFNSIKRMVIGQTVIEYTIQINDCTLKNPSFKRLADSLSQQEKIVLADFKKNQGTDLLPIQIICDKPYLNNIIYNLLQEIGHANINIVSNSTPGIQSLQDTSLWIKLNDFPGTIFRGEHINWTDEVVQILQSLKHFLDVEHLQPLEHVDSMPIPEMEFKQLTNKIVQQEKQTNSTIRQAQNVQMLYKQEHIFLKTIEPFSRMLMAAVNTSQNWEAILQHPESFQQSRALLLCEDENEAAELNTELGNVPLKLWLNPMKLKEPEDLLNFDTDTIRSYFQPGVMILTSNARKHLESICQHTFQKSKESEAVYQEQKLIIKNGKKEILAIKKKKNQLALRWINVTLKQIIYRDRHLLKLGAKNSQS